MMRSVAQGTLETAAHTFLLLIALNWYEAGELAKALVAAAGSFGLLISPLVVSQVEHIGCRVSKAASTMLGVGALSLLLVTAYPTLPMFVIGTIVAMACSAAVIPLMTQIYQDNYPGKERGRKFSRTVMIRILSAIIFSFLAGRMLDADIERSRLLLLMFACAFAFSSYCVSQIPSEPLHVSGGRHPLRALRFVKTDPLFRVMLIAWMFMGFGNLLMFPMRLEHLANPVYGLGFSPLHVALILGVVPNVARLLTSMMWGWLFDHMNFFLLRTVLNLGFMYAIGIFFNSTSIAGLVIGAILFGISHSGGDVAWSLWVTKFAPPERVADYMSTHTFCTGVRGAIAPMIAYALVGSLGIPTLAVISIGFIIISVLMLGKEIPAGRKGRNESALTEDVSE